MADKEQLYTNKIFLCGALPLLKTIVQDVPSLKKKFEKVHCVYQVSCLDKDAPDGKWATHFVVNGDEWLIHANKVAERVDKQKYVELEFKSVEAMNAFFKGKIGPATLPKMKGINFIYEFGVFMMALLKMADALIENADEILIANKSDLEKAKGTISDVMLDRLALILTIIGAVNWGSIGFFQFDFVAWLFGGQDAVLSRIIYTLVALAGAWCVSLLFRERTPARTH